jgi:hypothetical protein
VSIAAVRKQIVVEAPLERAWRIFTEHVEAWWPREHHIAKQPFVKIVMEPRKNGRWFEVAADGSECPWGEVLVWEAPRRLVLGWQLTAKWEYDASFLTEVEVTFTAEGPRRTRVDLEHRNLERYGEAAEAHRRSLDSNDGWMLILEQFKKNAAG